MIRFNLQFFSDNEINLGINPDEEGILTDREIDEILGIENGIEAEPIEYTENTNESISLAKNKKDNKKAKNKKTKPDFTYKESKEIVWENNDNEKAIKEYDYTQEKENIWEIEDSSNKKKNAWEEDDEESSIRLRQRISEVTNDSKEPSEQKIVWEDDDKYDGFIHTKILKEDTNFFENIVPKSEEIFDSRENEGINNYSINNIPTKSVKRGYAYEELEEKGYIEERLRTELSDSEKEALVQLEKSNRELLNCDKNKINEAIDFATNVAIARENLSYASGLEKADLEFNEYLKKVTPIDKDNLNSKELIKEYKDKSFFSQEIAGRVNESIEHLISLESYTKDEKEESLIPSKVEIAKKVLEEKKQLADKDIEALKKEIDVKLKESILSDKEKEEIKEEAITHQNSLSQNIEKNIGVLNEKYKEYQNGNIKKEELYIFLNSINPKNDNEKIAIKASNELTRCIKCGGILGKCSCLENNKKEEVKEETRQEINSKIRKINHLDFTRLEGVGEAYLNAIENIQEEDSTSSQGLRELKSSNGTKISRILLSGAGQNAADKCLIYKAERIYESADTAFKVLNKESGLSLKDFKSKKDLSEALSDIKELTIAEKAAILKNRKAIEKELIAKSEFEKLAKNSAYAGRIGKEGTEYLKSSKYFSNENKDKYSALAYTYFDVKSKDKNLEKINFQAMSEKKRKEFYKNAKKYGFSKEEAAVGSILSYRTKVEKAKRRLKNKENGKLKGLISLGLESSVLTESSYKESINKIRSAERYAYVFAKTAKVSAKILGKVTGISFIARKSGKLIKKGTDKVKQNHIEKKKEKKSLTNPVKEKVKMGVHKAKKRFGESSLGKGINKTSNGFKNAKRSIAESKYTKTGKKIGKKVKKGAKTTGRILTSPIRATNKVISLIFGVKKYLVMICGGSMLIITIVYLLIFASGMLMTSCSGAGSVKQNTEKVYEKLMEVHDNYISYDNYDDMKLDIENLLENDREVYKECEDLGKGHPVNNNVLEGKKIANYGSPDKEKGYSITYKDAYGNIMPNKSTNVKDVEALCIAMVDNNLGFYGDYEEDKKNFDLLINDMYELMMYKDPDTGKPYEYEESDIYVCDFGCSLYKYYCNDESYYREYERYKSDGVGSYGELVTPTYMDDHYDGHCMEEDAYEEGSGCRYKISNKLVRIYRFNDGRKTNADEYDDYFGYAYVYSWLRDGLLEEDWEYVRTYSFYCPGHEVPICYGHKDIDIYVTLYDIQYVVDNNIYPDDIKNKPYWYLVESWYEGGAWESEKSEEIAWNYEDGDWYDLYGVTIEGCEFNTRSTLNSNQIGEILARYDGDVTKARKELIEYGLNYVGKIAYYYGGKMSVAGYEGNGFGEKVEPDVRGRTTDGLDCSGFVQWVYKSALGLDVKGSTSAYSGMKEESYSDLQVGDLGFIKKPGADNNHVAIYMGKNESGQDEWLECNAQNGACITTSTSYRYFINVLGQ